MTTPGITKRVRDTFRPRFSWRPYVLRAYFDTQLIAESKGTIAHDFRVFFMGHQGQHGGNIHDKQKHASRKTT
ncbi:MAG: hypothetical protein K8823_414 [Cenarchaeum symbiont of Oopsacas minuta]|nr:hypothetical protein [Cenarchaeum symbiont of Oopsacas minuta]